MAAVPAAMVIIITMYPDAYAHMDLVCACAGALRSSKLPDSEAQSAENDYLYCYAMFHCVVMMIAIMS
jgi:hypothetical protein